MAHRQDADAAQVPLDGPVDRRQFLAVMGASAALAGAAGCSPKPAPAGHLAPYVRQPEPLVPGRQLTFATAFALGGAAVGLLVASREGRPVKIEGNPTHPGSLGATDVYAQASLLDLYDPDRSKGVICRGAPRAPEEALAALRAAVAAQRPKRGAGLRVLTGAVASPTLGGLLAGLFREFPEAVWVRHEPAAGAAGEGARRAFGEPLHPVYDFSKADVVVALDADFLGCEPGTVHYQRQFADRRRVRFKDAAGVRPAGMNRLYAVETMLTTTGAVADHRLPLKPSRVEAFARALAAELGVAGAPPAGPLPAEAHAWIKPLADDLRAHRGRGLVLVGDGQAAPLHALGHAVNAALGNFGATVHFTDPVEARPTEAAADLRRLADDLTAGRVELLLVFGTNPAYTAPADLDFAAALRRAGLSFHLGPYRDETAAACHWHVNEAHYLETWGDARGFDGTAAIQQPLVEPLYGGRSPIEFVAAATAAGDVPGLELVRNHWRAELGKRGDFDAAWRSALQDGVIPGTALPRRQVNLRPDWAKDSPPADEPAGPEVQFRPDPTVYDGRFANNGWLQELPKPVTKLTWGNAAVMSPATAARLGVRRPEARSPGGEHGHAEADVVELRYRGRTVRAPAWVLPGHADDAVTLHLGHGRTAAGRVGTGVGFDAYRLRPADAPWIGGGLEVVKTGATEAVACTQYHHPMGTGEKDPVRHYTAGDVRDGLAPIEPPRAEAAAKAAVTAVGTDPARPGGERDPRLVPLSLYPEYPYEGRKWGMAIDLSACTGCSACVVACQAENNIPVVGKAEVLRGREMHWIRVDSRTAGDPDRADGAAYFFQPVPCMHCEKAPCEVVCPVGATVHSSDGLNDMVYNRCVGTRYCSNNCPYKVRRFNFLQYADFDTVSLKLLHNPEVTVRSRGVMEKCTYCVQRLRAAGIDADAQDRPIPDGSVQTACQQACPSRAIVFGDLNDAGSEVRRWKAEPHDYGLLADLNTQPRTTYLAAVRNPNPAVPGRA